MDSIDIHRNYLKHIKGGGSFDFLAFLKNSPPTQPCEGKNFDLEDIPPEYAITLTQAFKNGKVFSYCFDTRDLEKFEVIDTTYIRYYNPYVGNKNDTWNRWNYDNTEKIKRAIEKLSEVKGYKDETSFKEFMRIYYNIDLETFGLKPTDKYKADDLCYLGGEPIRSYLFGNKESAPVSAELPILDVYCNKRIFEQLSNSAINFFEISD